MSNTVEPSNAERAGWSDVTRAYVESLEQESKENEGVIKVWRRRVATAENKKTNEAIDIVKRRIKRLEDEDLPDARRAGKAHDQIEILTRLNELRLVLGSLNEIKNETGGQENG